MDESKEKYVFLCVAVDLTVSFPSSCQSKTLMGDVMKDAAFSLAEAKFASGGDFNQGVIQNVTKSRIKIRSKMDNVAGRIIYVYVYYVIIFFPFCRISKVLYSTLDYRTTNIPILLCLFQNWVQNSMSLLVFQLCDFTELRYISVQVSMSSQ